MKKLLILAAALALATPAMAANSLAVTGAAALEGNYGLAVTVDGASNNNDTYVVTAHPTGETTYRFSFRINPNNFDMDNSTTFKSIFIGNIRKATPDRNFMFAYLMRQADGWYSVQFNARNDNFSFPTWLIPIKVCHPTLAPTCASIASSGVKITFEWQASSGANDGFWRGYREGVLARENTGLDNDQWTVEEGWFGLIWMGNNTGDGSYQANGTFYFDSFESYRTLAP